MRTIAQRIGGLETYLNNYEEHIYPKYLSKSAGEPFSQIDVWEALADPTPAGSGPILDLGCGTGWFARRLAMQQATNCPKSPASVIGVDLSRRAIAWAQRARDQSGLSPKRLSFVVADLNDPEFKPSTLGLAPGERAQAAWLCGCLHQMQDPKGALEQTLRLLEPGARLCIQTLEEPARHNQWVDVAVMRALGQRIFPHGALATMLNQAGCELSHEKRVGFVLLSQAVVGESVS